VRTWANGKRSAGRREWKSRGIRHVRNERKVLDGSRWAWELRVDVHAGHHVGGGGVHFDLHAVGDVGAINAAHGNGGVAGGVVDVDGVEIGGKDIEVEIAAVGDAVGGEGADAVGAADGELGRGEGAVLHVGDGAPGMDAGCEGKGEEGEGKETKRAHEIILEDSGRVTGYRLSESFARGGEGWKMRVHMKRAQACYRRGTLRVPRGKYMGSDVAVSGCG